MNYVNGHRYMMFISYTPRRRLELMVKAFTATYLQNTRAFSNLRVPAGGAVEFTAHDYGKISDTMT